MRDDALGDFVASGTPLRASLRLLASPSLCEREGLRRINAPALIHSTGIARFK